MRSDSLHAVSTEVLIVGAGPTGLMLAAWLTRRGIRLRIIDSKPGPAPETRAIAVQARTLEFYDQLGLGERAHREGREVPAASVWSGRNVVRVSLSDLGQTLSPHPYVFVLTQDRNEALLLEDLRRRGVEVEWNTALTGLRQEPGGVAAEVLCSVGQDEIRCRYLCGADGARSATRHLIAADFPGGTYSRTFYVADVTASGDLQEGDLNLCLDQDDFQAFFPLPGRDHHRVVGLVPASTSDRPPTFEEVRPVLARRFRTEVLKLHWFATYRVHHRVAAPWRQGDVFLLGDAAHVHSPAGGQGMNTGLGDAVNLAWKLAAVLRGQAVPALLDTFEAERRPFAEQLVETTDRAFEAVVSPAPLARTLRTRVVPQVLSLLVRLPQVRRLMFRTVSQTRLGYPRSALSRGRGGRVRGGDRLPWIPGLYRPLTDLNWHLFVVGAPTPEALAWAARRAIGLHAIPCTAAAQRAGYREGCALLVRPDGHVGLVEHHFEARRFSGYWRAIHPEIWDGFQARRP